MTTLSATIAAASAANETNGRFIVDDTTASSTHHFPGDDGDDDDDDGERSPSSSSLSNNNKNNMPIYDDHTSVVLSSGMPAVNNKGSSSDGAVISRDADADAHEKVADNNDNAAAVASSSSTSSTQLNQPKTASSSSPTSSSPTYQRASPPSQNHQQQQQQQPNQEERLLDETKLQKAIAFLHNPTIRDVSNTNKRIYLERNTDLNNDEIDAAMGRIRMMEHNGGGSYGDDGNVRDTGGSSSTDDIQGREGDHHQREEWPNQRHGDRYNPNDLLPPPPPRGHPTTTIREDDYYDGKDNYTDSNGARRYPPPSQHPPLSAHHAQGNDYYYNTGNTWQRREHDPHYRGEDDVHHGNDHPQHHHRARGEMTPIPGAGAGGGGGTSWLGGFSLGILGLAAWRWLNGGDFVLFPPPSIMSSTSTTMSNLVNDNGTMSVAVAAKKTELTSCPEEVEEQEEEENEDEEEDQGDEEEESEEEGNDENEDEYNEEDEFLASRDLHAILNHKNSHSRYPVQQQPSYDELVLEIRALTSAIHSHRDSQERIARNAYNSNVGKGMTDDAMDFLRKKREASKKVEVSKSENDQLNVVASLLKEVSGDLNDLKQSTNLVQHQSRDQGCTQEHGATEERSMEEETVVDVEGPINQIDLVIGKVQKILAIVDEKLNANEEENIVTFENGNNNSDGAGDDGGYIGTVEEGDEMFMSASTVSEVDQLNALVVASESIVSKDVADVANTEESGGQQSEESCETSQNNLPEQPEQQQQHQLKQLEDALRTLATNNDAQTLKVGAQMLYLYCRNISQNASVPRYRKIYTNNNTFRSKVGNLVGAKDFLMAVGFVEHAKENLYEWSEQQAGGDGGENIDTEAMIKSKLDFALVALELMKNGGAGAHVDGGDQKDGA